MKATFGAGCFWHVQDTFSDTKGVIKARAGYMGGDEKKFPKPTYEQVCSDKSGYVEVVQVEFDESKVGYKDLLEIFWKLHDPTSIDRQGLDTGTQYRSVIFYHDEKHKKEAIESQNKVQGNYSRPVVTKIRKAATFFPAEEYHQDYIKKHGLVC